ncbi:hypothetical protein GCM10009836_44670 [Pseudonocardia ailaonensis]|uniref:Uncharacterized protein n=1 Tax=Pseudonocardia ailaonensis TaxID=367279 RepID=A0ABN2N9V1_9PSEU
MVVDGAGVMRAFADVDPDPQFLAGHVMAALSRAVRQPMDVPACSSVNSDRAQISISGQGVRNGRAATPSKPLEGKNPSATPCRYGRPEHLVPNINNLTENP